MSYFLTLNTLMILGCGGSLHSAAPTPSTTPGSTSLTLTDVSPSVAPLAGGIKFTLSGTAFGSDLQVTVDSLVCGGVAVLSATSAQCTAPAHTAGIVDVSVTSSGQTATMLNTVIYSN